MKENVDYTGLFRELEERYLISDTELAILNQDTMIMQNNVTHGITVKTILAGNTIGLRITTLTGYIIDRMNMDLMKEINKKNCGFMCGGYYVDEDLELCFRSFIFRDTVSATAVIKAINLNINTIKVTIKDILETEKKETVNEDYKIMEVSE